MADADYSEFRAVTDLLTEDRAAQGRAAEVLDSNDFAAVCGLGVPSSAKINVTVLNALDEFLVIERSGAVDDKSGLWTVGPNETMKHPAGSQPGDAGEDFFVAAQRCLREELGLEPHDYGDIIVSWCGFHSATLQFKVFAHVRVHLPARRIDELIGSAHSVYEASRWEWLPFDRSTVAQIVQGWDNGALNRRWSDSAPLSLQEMWRVRALLCHGS